MTGNKKLEEVLSDDSATLAQIIEAQECSVANYGKEFAYRPIVINGDIRRYVSKYVSIDQKEKLFLHSKLSDPCLSIRDYINFETELNLLQTIQFSDDDGLVLALPPTERLLFEWILLPCKGIISISKIFEDEDLLQDQRIVVDEVQDPNAIKFLDIITRSNLIYCAGVCRSPHYLIGRGTYKIEEKLYSGVHIVIYPDDDNLYDKFYQIKSNEYASAYFSQFKAVINNIA